MADSTRDDDEDSECVVHAAAAGNTTTSAYFDCISDAVMGCGAPLEHTCRWDSTGKLSIAPILGDLLVAKWTEAFAGGCPLIPAVAAVNRE